MIHDFCTRLPFQGHAIGMPSLMKNFVLVAVVGSLASATDCGKHKGSCVRQFDEVSLLQLEKIVKTGREALGAAQSKPLSLLTLKKRAAYRQAAERMKRQWPSQNIADEQQVELELKKMSENAQADAGAATTATDEVNVQQEVAHVLEEAQKLDHQTKGQSPPASESITVNGVDANPIHINVDVADDKLPPPGPDAGDLHPQGAGAQNYQARGHPGQPTPPERQVTYASSQGLSPEDIAVVAALAADIAKELGQTTATTTPVVDIPMPGTTTPNTASGETTTKALSAKAILGLHGVTTTTTPNPNQIALPPVPATTTSTPPAVPPSSTNPPPLPQVNETLQEQIDENIMQSTPTTSAYHYTTMAPAQISAQEEAADAMVDHAAAQLKAFNDERTAAASVAVWTAAQKAAKDTAKAAKSEKDSVDKGLKAVKATAKAAKATVASLTVPPNPRLAAAYGNNLASISSPAMKVPMTEVNPDNTPALAPTVAPPFSMDFVPTVDPTQLLSQR